MDLLALASWDFAEWLVPFLALALMLAALVVAINVVGKRLGRHEAWLDALDARVGNLHKDRELTWARELARPFSPPLVPPPLPPRAPTLDASDWRDDDLKTEDLATRQTGRYPAGIPPKGPNDA